MNAKAYLGDAVYAEWDGFYVVLTANGNEQTIYLDPAVWESLRRFVEAIHATEG